MSKTKQRDIETAIRLGMFMQSHAQDVGPKIGEWLRPCLREGETLPDYTLVLELPARMISQAGHRLRESEIRIAESRNLENEARERRDHAATALRRKLLEYRQLLMAIFGPKRTAKLLGFGGATAKASQPALLLSQSEALLKALRDPKGWVIPDSVLFDSASAAVTLESPLVAFREAYGQLEGIHQAHAVQRQAGNRVRAELVRGIQCVVRVCSGWFELIRRADLVKKIKGDS